MENIIIVLVIGFGLMFCMTVVSALLGRKAAIIAGVILGIATETIMAGTPGMVTVGHEVPAIQASNAAFLAGGWMAAINLMMEAIASIKMDIRIKRNIRNRRH